MKPRNLLATVLFIWLVSIDVGALHVTHPVELRALTIENIPPCGLSCLFTSVPPTGCGLNDVDCQCQNAELAQTLSACMLSNCTMEDSLDTAKVQHDLCHFSDESMQRDIYVYTITCYTVATIFVFLRVVGRRVAGRFNFNDCIVVAALLFTAVPLGLVLKMAGIGFGEHLWNLQEGQLLENLRFFYVAWTTYTFVLGLTKISLTLFYYEVFPSPPARMGSFILLGWIATNTLVLVFFTIFNCNPVQAFWDRDIENAKCLSINAIAYANSTSAIVQDVLLLAYPMVCIWTLNMKKWRKMAVAFMFAVGTFGCIATIIRLHSLLTFKTSIDPTWDYVPITVWTEIELACCFACVSSPAIRILLVRVLPERFFSTISSRFRSRMTTGPIVAANNTHSDSAPPRRAFRSWLHITTAHDESTYQSTELTVLRKAVIDEQNEKGFGGEAEIADVEEEHLPGSRGHRRNSSEYPRYTL